MNRIDPTKAPDVFHRIGMRPVQYATWRKDRGECDLVMAHFIDRQGVPREYPKGSMAAYMGWSIWYGCGLMWGWDGHVEADVREWCIKKGTPDWDEVKLGIDHAREAFYQCEKAGLIRQEEHRIPVLSR